MRKIALFAAVVALAGTQIAGPAVAAPNPAPCAPGSGPDCSKPNLFGSSDEIIAALASLSAIVFSLKVALSNRNSRLPASPG